MNARELALAMLDWEQLKREADELVKEIQAAVLKIGKTQTVGYVRASYSKGRKSYNYKEAAQDVPPSIVRAHTTLTEIIDWCGICQDENIADIPVTQSNPRVTLKLLD